MSIGEHELCALAAEMAAHLRPAKDVLAAHSITPEQFKAIAATPQFRTIYAEAKRLWHEDTNTSERVRAKALLALEEMLVPLVAVVHDAESSPAVVLDGIRTTAKLAGMDSRGPAESDSASRFSVTINLPGQNPRTIEAEAVNEEDV